MYQFSDKIFDIAALLSCLQDTDSKRLVLFGAAGYGEALFDELTRRMIPLPIVFADNDPTKQGRLLRDRPIISPKDTDPSTDLVVITTISAGDQVSAQLESLGFTRDMNYFEVMQKLDYSHAFDVIDFYQGYVRAFGGLDILHVGPGGHLGVEILLSVLGARSVYSVEYHSFRLQYPDVTEVERFYTGLAETAKKKWQHDIYQNGPLIQNGKTLNIRKDMIHLLYPCSVTALPFAEFSFDLVLHHAVFEHVPDPEKGYGEIFRVLRPGGKTVGLVDPQDHRTFSSFKEYHPLKFLEHSRQEWYELARDINFHNQVTTPEHRQMALSQGFRLDKWDVLVKMDVSEEIWQSFHPQFSDFDRDEIGILRFAFSATRPVQ